MRIMWKKTRLCLANKVRAFLICFLKANYRFHANRNKKISTPVLMLIIYPVLRVSAFFIMLLDYDNEFEDKAYDLQSDD